MCGITGFLDRRPAADALRMMPETIRRMAAALDHRGPDAHGVWIDRPAGIALGHTRLAIVDLSAAGAQPMISADQRQVLVYNGELYNADELRRELEAQGYRLRGRSDSEVLLEGCAAWGVEACLRRVNGMFAFALFDLERRCLTLARDRLGEKPLYWGLFGGLLLFGSELKALREHPGWSPEVDRDALASYLRWRYVPAPLSIFKGVWKLPPAHILEWQASDPEPRMRPYWSPPDAGECLALDDEEAVERLDTLLRDAVARRMIADVPLGAFLSGGIDSSLVVALMQAQAQKAVKTFSIGFREAGFDEAPHARAVAEHLGTEHTELYLEPNRALEVVPGLPAIYNEPFADASQIPTHVLAALTRRHVTVALSGDGGDELFAGYRRYFAVERLWRLLRQVPRPLRAAAARALDGLLARSGHASAFGRLAAGLPSSERLEHWSLMLSAADAATFYRHRQSQWIRPEALLQTGHDDAAPDASVVNGADFLSYMQRTDLRAYLPDDILVKVDRATMAVALEARVPLLDHRVVELAMRLPRRLKVRDGNGKWLMRRVLDRYVPEPLVQRPKSGFSVPLGAWLRGPLRDWAEDLLDERRLAQEGYFRPELIRERWQQHLSGKRNWHAHLWTVLMFQAWAQHNGTSGTGTMIADEARCA